MATYNLATWILPGTNTLLNTVNATIDTAGNLILGGSITATNLPANKFNINTWTTVSGTTQALAMGNGYYANNAGLVTFTLPATFAVGEVIAVMGQGAGGWKIAQNASQIIRFGDQFSATGTGGSWSSSQQYDNIVLVGMVANTTMAVRSAVGNITPA